MLEMIVPGVVTATMFFLIGWIVRTVTVNRRLTRLAQAQIELQGKLIDRFGSTAELAAYLNSEAGRKLLEVAAVERSTPHARVLGAIQTGVVLLFGGSAFLFMRGAIPSSLEGFTFVGTLGVCLGLAFLVSAALAWGLSRRWGLIADRPAPGEGGA